jgi:hypothetical protein
MSRKKIKKALKMLGAGAAIAGLGKAFMANRNKGADANDGFREMFTRPNMLDIAGGRRKRMINPAEFLIGVGDDPVIPGIQAGAKKGGRIMKTKKGGRAVRKAKRSKKK